jgi:predicted lipase
MDGVGHSLGGALASIAALSVKSNLPSAAVRLFTYGALLSWAGSKLLGK